MAEWIGYDAWLAKNKLARTAANAGNWTRQYGPGGLVPKPGTAPAAPAAAPEPGYQQPAPAPYTPPAYDPNFKDAQGISEWSATQAKYDTQRLNAQNAYAMYLNQTYGDGAATATKDAAGRITGYNYDLSKRGGRFLEIDRNEREGREGAVNASAARGMLRSGSRIENEGKVSVAAGEQRTGIQQQQQNAQREMDAAVTSANTDSAMEEQRIGRESNMRNLDEYNRKHGMNS